MYPNETDVKQFSQGHQSNETAVRSLLLARSVNRSAKVSGLEVLESGNPASGSAQAKHRRVVNQGFGQRAILAAEYPMSIPGGAKQPAILVLPAVARDDAKSWWDLKRGSIRTMFADISPE